MYFFFPIVGIILYFIWYIYKFISINKNQLILIFKRALFFHSNPMIRNTIILSTFKFILKLIRKSFLKF